MGVLTAEFLKLKRSQSWLVVVLGPLLIVAAGTANTLASGAALADGWHTLWLRTVVFFGLFPLAAAVAVLASLSWRAEHRQGNWNALMAGPTSSATLVLAKTLVVAALAAVMQLVLLGAVIAVGMLGFGLPAPPATLFATSALIAAGCLPLAAVQSWLSMRWRSFAAPVAVALVAAGVAMVLLAAGVRAAIFVLPHALAARSTQLATGTFGDGGALTGTAVLSVLAATAVLTLGCLAGATRSLDRRDVRA